MGGRVVAIGLVSFLLLSVLSVSPPVATQLEEHVEAFSTSGVSIVFSNGPAEDESVTGLKTVTFSLSGSGTIDSILVEIAEVATLQRASKEKRLRGVQILLDSDLPQQPKQWREYQ